MDVTLEEIENANSRESPLEQDYKTLEGTPFSKNVQCLGRKGRGQR